MSHSAKILADSISPNGVRLTTMEVVVPRIVLAEFNTHRMFSRNSASSRAIPVEKMLSRVMEHPYVPLEFGANQKGMQAGAPLTGKAKEAAESWWLSARDEAVRHVKMLQNIIVDEQHTYAVHKQLTNRLLEPWLWHTIIVSATEWDNFFHLRCHPDAHPDIRKTAELMRNVLEYSEPEELSYNDWHLPLVSSDDYEELIQADPTHPTAVQQRVIKVSVGRCARVSYLTHDGKRDLEEDIKFHDKLLNNGHMSPFEHVARPMTKEEVDEWRGDGYPRHAGNTWCGNFRGWIQYRKTIPNEHDIKGHTDGAENT